MKTFLYSTFIFLAVSCVKTGKEDLPESRLDIQVSIDQSLVSDQMNEEFNSGDAIGLFVYESEVSESGEPTPMSEFSLCGERYRNIRAVYDSESEEWRFNFENATTLFESISLIKPMSAGLAVVGYAPWIENVSSITEIPFTLGGKIDDVKDLLWARQNACDPVSNPVDPGKNYNIVPDGNVKQVEFTFRHAFAKLRIGFRSLDDQTKTLTSITLKKASEGKTAIPVSGNFNAMTGTAEKVARANSLTYEYDQPFSSSTNYAYASLLICPQDYVQDGDYILEFEINGKKHASAYAIKLADVAGGFKAGEIYTLNFTVGEDVVFDSAEVLTEWIY